MTEEEVTIQVPVQWLADLIVAAHECAQDLYAEIEAKHPKYETDPVQSRRHGREADVCFRIQRLVKIMPDAVKPEIDESRDLSCLK